MLAFPSIYRIARKHGLACSRNGINQEIEVDNFQAENTKMMPPSKRKFLALIGVHELFSLEMWRAVITELVATACLLSALTTTIIACLESNVSEPKLLVPVAVFVVAFLLLVVTVPLTGGHMNPIFTFIAALKGVITFVRALFYVVAQCVGSLIASLIIKGAMSSITAKKYALGGCVLDANSAGVSAGTALIIEFSCTFLLLYVAITLAFDKERCKELGLAMICVIVAAVYGLAVFMSITITGKAGYGGVGLNPARCLAPAVLLGGSLWHGHWVFWMGPFFACIVYHFFTLILPREGFVRADEEPHFPQLAKRPATPTAYLPQAI